MVSIDIDGILSLSSGAALHDIKLPSNMEQIVHARIDELEEDPKQILAIIAVFDLPIAAGTLVELMDEVRLCLCAISAVSMCCGPLCHGNLSVIHYAQLKAMLTLDLTQFNPEHQLISTAPG